MAVWPLALACSEFAENVRIGWMDGDIGKTGQDGWINGTQWNSMDSYCD